MLRWTGSRTTTALLATARLRAATISTGVADTKPIEIGTAGGGSGIGRPLDMLAQAVKPRLAARERTAPASGPDHAKLMGITTARGIGNG